MPVEKYFGGKGRKVMKAMKKQYGEKKGKQVFYATANKREHHSADVRKDARLLEPGNSLSDITENIRQQRSEHCYSVVDGEEIQHVNAGTSAEYNRMMMLSTPDNSNAYKSVDDTFSKADMARGYKTLFDNDKLHTMEVDRWTDETLAERRNPGHLVRSDVEETHGPSYMEGKKRWRHEEVEVEEKEGMRSGTPVLGKGVKISVPHANPYKKGY